MPLEFNPTNGYRNGTYFPNPASEEETRDQMMNIPDQIKDYINNLEEENEELKKGQMYFLSQDTGTITLGSYSEWVEAGKPPVPTS